MPIAVMTYYNLVFRAGHKRMARSLAAAGRQRVPSSPTFRSRRSSPWAAEADAAGVDTVLLVAPSTPRRPGGAHLRAGTRLRLRRRPHGRDGGARGPRVGRDEGRRAHPPPHRHARVRRRGRLDAGSGRRRCARWRTASWWDRRWCAACSRARAPTGRPPSSGRSARRSTRPVRAAAVRPGRQGALPCRRRVRPCARRSPAGRFASSDLADQRVAHSDPVWSAEPAAEQALAATMCSASSGQRGVGHGFGREDPRVGGADPVAVEGMRDVDQGDVLHAVPAGVGHRAGHRLVQGGEHDVRGRGGADSVGLQARADQIGVRVPRAPSRRRSRWGREWAGSSRGPRRFRRRARSVRWQGRGCAHVGEIGGNRRRDGPVVDAVRPEADARPQHAGEFVLEAGAEVDVVGAVLEHDQPGPVLRQVLTPRSRRRGCGSAAADGHWPLGSVLSAATATAPLMASWSPTSRQLVGRTVMVSPKCAGHHARVGQRRRALGDALGREPDLRRQVGVGQPVAVGDRVAEGDGAPDGHRRGRAGTGACVATRTTPATRAPDQATTATTWPGGSGAPRRPRF